MLADRISKDLLVQASNVLRNTVSTNFSETQPNPDFWVTMLWYYTGSHGYPTHPQSSNLQNRHAAN
jgi:hypothetical protein